MRDKKSDKLLPISIFLAAVIVAGAFVMSSAKKGESLHIPSLTPYSEQVVIEEALRTCQQGESCIVIDATCSFCCKYVAINAKHEKLFNQLFDKGCQSYRGPACERFDLSSYPACLNGKCELVKWDAEKKP